MEYLLDVLKAIGAGLAMVVGSFVGFLTVGKWFFEHLDARYFRREEAERETRLAEGVHNDIKTSVDEVKTMVAAVGASTEKKFETFERTKDSDRVLFLERMDKVRDSIEKKVDATVKDLRREWKQDLRDSRPNKATGTGG